MAAAASKSNERKRRRPSDAAAATARDSASAAATPGQSAASVDASNANESEQPVSESTQRVNGADATTIDPTDATRATTSTVDAGEAEEKAVVPVRDDASSNGTAATAIDISRKAHGFGDSDDDEEDEDDEDDDVLVVLELADFKNHPIFDDYARIRIEGIDTASPMLQIGEYTLYGQLEETVGTNFFYDTTKLRAHGNVYQYVGQTTKKIRFTIAPPPEQ